jgi:hypothetical protein
MKEASTSFFNHAGRPDSDFAALSHRGARTKKLFCSTSRGVENATGQKNKKVFWFFFSKKNFLLSFKGA